MCCWLGWMGFAVCLLLLVGHSLTAAANTSTPPATWRRSTIPRPMHGRDKVAIISVTGTILDGSFVKQQIDRVREDDHVKAVVLRVVSPGGTITGSDYIYHHLKKLRDGQADSRWSSAWAASRPAAATTCRWPSATRRTRSMPNRPRRPARSACIIPHYDLSGLLERFDVKDDSLATIRASRC